ncbi:MAG: Uma2 family endonuclease [Gemmatimonadetes bacterium]|nr:Uma2 family endonuclease [Gemmatimonadota bacterium]
MSVEDYLRSEACSPVKREYVRGTVRALAGASERHNRLAGRIYARLLSTAEARGCRFLISDMRLRVSEDVYYYPDVMVVCAADRGSYEKREPWVVIEVLSPSTRAVDEGEKRLAYTGLKSVEAYLLFDSMHPWAAGYYRTPTGFEERRWAGGGEIEARCAGVVLDLEELHRGL